MDKIFLVKDEKKIHSVYRDEVIQKIDVENLSRVYTKDDIIQQREKFVNVKYIFSTWYMPEFTKEEVKEYFPALEAVFYAAGTVKYFAEPFLQNDVRVFSAAKANGIPVAEFTVSQIILANKGYFQAQKKYKRPFFNLSYQQARVLSENKNGNYNTKVGIIGVGAVGRKVVELLKPYKLEVLAYDPYVTSEEMRKLGIHKVGIKDVFINCDVISNHLPDIIETKNILNIELFSLMKSTATFINTGRGAQVNEKDLIKALKEKSQRCALLDVTVHEPIWPWSPLLYMKNIFITPHIAGSLSCEEERMAEYMTNAYEDLRNGRENCCEITQEMLKTMA